MKWTKAVTKALITLVVLPATAIAVATAALVVPALNPNQEQTTTQAPTTAPTTNAEPAPTPKEEQVVDAPGTAYHGHTVASLILQAEANKAVAQPHQQQVTSFISSTYTPSKRPKPPTTSRPARTEGGGNKPKKRAKAPKSVGCQGYYPECKQTESREQELAMLEYDKKQALAASVPVFKPVPNVPKLLDNEGNIIGLEKTEAEKPLTQFPDASYSVEVPEKSTTNETGE